MLRSIAIASTTLLVFSLAPAHAQPAPAGSDSGVDAAELGAIEAETMRLVNEHRASMGLSPLRYDPDLAMLAREHSQNMGNGVVPFGHSGFEARVARAGRGTSAAENVAYSTRVDRAATDAMASWLKSPGHRAHIEGKRHVSGIGAAIGSDGKFYVTQLFFRG